MKSRGSRILEVLAGVGAVVGLATGWLGLRASEVGVARTDDAPAGTPVTVLAPAEGPPAPVVVVAHGFAGSRELMQAFSFSLAQSGYVAVAFDFPGHGDHPRLLGGTLGSEERVASLRTALEDVVAYARELERGDGRVALLGHSMAGDILVRYASDDPDTAAVVGLSPYLAEPPSEDALRAPLLVAYGGLEPELLTAMGRATVAEVADEPAPARIEPGVTYGSDAKRRLTIVEGAEHIGILFAPAALRESVTWLDGAFERERSEPVPIRPRRGALAAWYVGVVLLGFVLARRLPVVSAEPVGSRLGGRRFLVAAAVPAALTPLALTPIPTDVLPSILTDYIAFHLALYGILTAAILGWNGARLADLGRGLRLRPFGLALAATLLFELLLLGLATDRFVASFFPGPHRVTATIAAFGGATLWFVADEWLTRGPNAPRGAYAITKACFLASLVLGVVLNPKELFFLVLIIPAILALFVVYGALSRWIHQRTGHPLVAALAHALAFALVISATFPVVE